jgi:hypothetical protein
VSDGKRSRTGERDMGEGLYVCRTNKETMKKKGRGRLRKDTDHLHRPWSIVIDWFINRHVIKGWGLANVINWLLSPRRVNPAL